MVLVLASMLHLSQGQGKQLFTTLKDALQIDFFPSHHMRGTMLSRCSALNSAVIFKNKKGREFRSCEWQDYYWDLPRILHASGWRL